MLRTLDGYDRRWGSDVNWAGQARDHDREDMATIFKNHSFRARASSPTADFSLQGIDAVINQYAIVHSDVEEEVEATHEILRTFLFFYCRKEIKWLKQEH
jgi:ornithine carbamoyltransferase